MRFLILYVPFLLGWIVRDAPDISYWVAWAGSWFILWYSLSGWLMPLPGGLPWYEQMLRPFGLPQIVFAGFTCLSSVFYYFSLHGYVYFDQVEHSVDLKELYRTAQAQCYYVLAHAALIHGVFIKLAPPAPAFKLKKGRDLALNLQLLILFFGLNLFFAFIPGLSQWKERFGELALATSILLAAHAFIAGKRIYLIYGALIFGFFLMKAIFSGFKEMVIVPLLILQALLLPKMKKTTIFFVFPMVVVVALALPTFAQTFRLLAWRNEVDQRAAAAAALATVREGSQRDLRGENWTFLTSRFSEISMFTKYIQNVPEFHPFYEFQIIEQGLLNLVPRVLYPSKPITENVVMQRVLENGIIEDYSWGKVSAKPMIPVDGYTSFGAIGVWLFCLLMGLGSSYASREAERLFGGYVWGTCVVYTAMFQSFWRSNCVEFLLNSIFYAFILMYLLFFIGRKLGHIVPAREVHAGTKWDFIDLELQRVKAAAGQRKSGE